MPKRLTGAAAAPKMTVGSLFSGIGGFDEGLRRADMQNAWMVENDKPCREVLAWIGRRILESMEEQNAPTLHRAGSPNHPGVGK